MRARHDRAWSQRTQAAVFGAVFVMAPAVARAQAACGADVDASRADAARALFDQAQGAYDVGRWSDSEALVRRVLAIYDSPNARMVLGRVLAAQQRPVEAYAAFDSAARLASACSQRDLARRGRSRYGVTVADAVVARDGLVSRVALLALRFPSSRAVDAEVTADDGPARVLAVGQLLPVAPGLASLVVRAPGHDPQRFTGSLRAGTITEVVLRPARVVRPPALALAVVNARAPAPTASRAPWTALGLGLVTSGAVGVGVGLVLGVQARSEHDALAAMCAGMCPGDAAFSARIDAGEARSAVGTVLLTAGVGLAAVGAVTLLVSALAGRARPAERVSVRVAPGGVAFGVVF